MEMCGSMRICKYCFVLTYMHHLLHFDSVEQAVYQSKAHKTSLNVYLEIFLAPSYLPCVSYPTDFVQNYTKMKKGACTGFGK